MDLYTSYYTKVLKEETSDCILVQVSNTKPDWFSKELVSLESLAPSWKLINLFKNGVIDMDKFSDDYIRELDSKIDGAVIKKALEQMCSLCDVDNVILVCWEKDYENCHRTPLAQWLEDYGVVFKGEW